ncbi:MAG: winged helix-turn-helix domain-containing protein [Chloroflexi bacterium]|nr:winged helix-turn-helix domain-containing protein [Chloroflexota bacterium]
MIEHILRTERATFNYRLLAVVVLALGLYVQRATIATLPAAILLIVYLTYNMLLGRLVLPRVRSANVVYAMAAVDTMALSGGLYLAGGPGGALFFLFPLYIVYYAMFLGYRSALFSAITFSLAYAALHFITSRTGEISSIIAVQIPFLFLVAVLAGYLSARRLEERREKEELQEFIRVQAHAQSLAETAKALQKTWEIKPLLEETAAHLSSSLGLPYGVVALWDADSQRLSSAVVAPAVRKLGKKNWDEMVARSEPGAATLEAMEKGIPLALEMVSGDRKGPPSWAEELGVGPLVVIPLVTRGEKLGVVYIFDTGKKRAFPEKEIKLAQSYAGLAAEAVSRAQSYGKAQARIQQLAAELDSTVERLDRLKDVHRRPQLVVGDLRLDAVKEQAYVGERLVNLSPTEFQLLYSLAENAGQPVNQETLLRRVWGDDYRAQGNVVDVSVHRLRRKLEGGSAAQRIVTVRGRGYMLMKTPLASEPRQPGVSPDSPSD